MKNRSEISDEYKIDTSSLFKNNKEFEIELEKLNNDIKEISKYDGILMKENNLYKAFSLDESLSRRLMRLYTYAHLNNDFDLSVNIYNEYVSKVLSLYHEYSSLVSYMVPEILENEYEEILNKLKEYPDAKKYETSLKEIFRTKSHTLNKNEEFIVSKLVSPYESIEGAYSKLTDVDLKFGDITYDGKKEEFTKVLYYSLSEHKNRNVRKKAFKKLYDGYKGIINTNAELINGNVNKHNALASIRKYKSALEASVDSDNVDPKVYDTLLKSIDKNMSVVHKQWNVFKKALKVDKLHLYDLYAPIIKDFDKKYSYEEAKELILKSLNVMGSDYINIIKKAFDERWIDVYPNKNKRSGAYCTHCYETHPYVVTDFDNRLYDVSTIIHELGHAMQYYYSDKNNTYYDAEYTIFVAEVASQVNEILLNLYIINNTEDKSEKLTVYNNLIKQFKASVVRQTMFAEFEKIIHEAQDKGIALSVDYLNNTYYELNKKYFGKKVVIDDEIKYEWSRIPHFYYNFYVYQYATGYIAALKIATDIYNKKDKALENYLEFLKLGCTKDPVESLKIAGVDLKNEKTFDDAFKEFDRELDEFMKML